MQRNQNIPGFDPYRPLAASLKSGDSVNRWILGRPRERIVALLRGQRVLDVGCGTGGLTAMLAEAGCQALGVDSSPTMLAFAREQYPRVAFEQMDAGGLHFEREFDAAVISIALHEMRPALRGVVWEGMRRAVVPGGRLIAVDFTTPQRRGLTAGLFAGMIERDERGMLDVHPEHYTNYREFMQGGGLIAWLEGRGQAPEAVYPYLGGNLAVAVCRVEAHAAG